MTRTKHLHHWNLSYAEARELQTRLAAKVEHAPLPRRPRLIAGFDCAFLDKGKRIIAVAVVLERKPAAEKPPETGKNRQFELIETAHVVQKTRFPYIPGLLSFREAPACIAAAEKLESRPELFLVDGQGIAHPRRLGLAAHLGLFLDRPTVGCAKSRLTGTFDEPAAEKGSYTPLRDKPACGESREPETIGAVVRTRTSVKPLFVSVGHKCTLDDAVEMTLACATRYRLPEPTRLAHQLVSRLKKEL